MAGGYGRSLAQLERIMTGSLAARQGMLTASKVCRVVCTMQDAGMIEERADPAHEDRPHRLAVTPLGRVAVRHMLYPATLLQFQRVCRVPQLAFFDLLLLVTSTQDCEPLLPVDYEELDDLAARVRAEPSRLLAMDMDALEGQLGIGGKRLLASIKMALIVRTLTRGGETGEVAERFGCYPFELDRLADSVLRLLLALGACVKVQERAGQPGPVPGWQSDSVTLAERAQMLHRMVAARLDETAVTLTRVCGIGPKLARRLVEHGIGDIARLASTSASDLAKVRGISPTRAETLVGEARLVATVRDADSYHEEATGAPCAVHRLETRGLAGADPYRLHRARELTVRPLGKTRFRVTGGTDPHEIREVGGELQCDCADFRKAQRQCKHVLAVRLTQGQYAPPSAHEQAGALDLLDLWMAGTPDVTPRVAQGWR